ncbi:unnamed protein product [Caenorhabditis nigoni]
MKHLNKSTRSTKSTTPSKFPVPNIYTVAAIKASFKFPTSTSSTMSTTSTTSSKSPVPTSSTKWLQLRNQQSTMPTMSTTSSTFHTQKFSLTKWNAVK